MQNTCAMEKLDKTEVLLEASPSTTSAELLHQVVASVIVMKHNTTDESECI